MRYVGLIVALTALSIPALAADAVDDKAPPAASKAETQTATPSPDGAKTETTDKAEKADQAEQTEPTRERLRVIVLDLKGGGAEPTQLEALTGFVTVTLSEYAPLDVLSGADVRAMVELEGEKQAMGCESDTSCLAEIAGAMGARLVVFGQIAKLGTRYVLNLSLFDSEEGKAVGRSAVAADTLDGVFEQLPAGVHKLVGPFLTSQGFDGEGRANAVVAASRRDDGDANPFAIVLPLGVLTTAAGLVAGGLALDLLLPTSHDKELEGVDFAPVGLYLVAAGAGVAGVVLFFANPLE